MYVTYRSETVTTTTLETGFKGAVRKAETEKSAVITHVWTLLQLFPGATFHLPAGILCSSNSLQSMYQNVARSDALFSKHCAEQQLHLPRERLVESILSQTMV